MRNTGGIAKSLATLMLATLCAGAQAEENFSVSVLYGKKYLHQTDWEPTEAQTELGLGGTYPLPNWPVIMVGHYLRSTSSGTDPVKFPGLNVNGSTTELSFGARKNLTEGATKIFTEGGLAFISGKKKFENSATGESTGSSDSRLGLWLGAGLDAMVSNAISLGGVVRLSKADENGSALGGIHFGIYAAYHFSMAPPAPASVE